MEDQDQEDLYQPPIDTNTFALPQDHGLLLAYEVYKPSIDTKRLKSEQGRHIFAEAFIENMKLGTLSDLSVRALANEYGTDGAFPMIQDDPLKMRIHYDSLKIDLPLDQCYYITDMGYWRRVVLAKTDDKALAFLKEYDWRSHGLSLKYVDMVEASSAEYWEDEKMTELANKIQEFVTQMHIRRLQSLTLRSFEHFFDSDSESLGSEDSSEMSTVSDTTESEVEEDIPQPEELPNDEIEIVEKTVSQLAMEKREAEARLEYKAELHEDRERRRKMRAIKIDRRERRAAIRMKAMEEELAATKKKKKKKKAIKSIYDIELSSDEDNREDDEQLNIPDHRNKATNLHRLKKYKFPPEDCHHIDLSFIRHFQHLTTFVIEFLGPLQGRDYHIRHMNFSYVDIERLANGLSFLRLLRVFRLRNSRMDARKLTTLAKVLKKMESLEVIDFGNDQLQDDCGDAMYNMLSGSCTTVTTLELEGNFFGYNTMDSLGKAIASYPGELNYLGLSNNFLGDAAMHALVTHINDTEQVRELNLTGVDLTQEGISCCIANELLRTHEVLLRLNLMGMHIGWTAGNELLKALEKNRTIVELECRGCNLDYDMEFDFAVLVRRNNFIAQNPFIGATEVTEEEINEWVSRIKNPILLDANEQIEKRATCYAQRPDEFQLDTGSKTTIGTVKETEEVAVGQLVAEESHSSEESINSDNRSSTDSCISCNLPFVYDTSTFDEKEFLDHLFVPGPSERYHYFQEMKRPGYYKDIEEL